MKYKNYLPLLLLFFTVTNLNAQQVVFSGQYLNFSAGTKIKTLYDNSVSSIHNTGLTAGTMLSYYNNKPNRRWWVEMNFDGGFYNSNYKNFPSIEHRSIDNIAGGYNIGFVAPIYKITREFYVWGGFSATGNYQHNNFLSFSNSSNNYTLLNNIGLNGMLHYTFNAIDKWWALEWHFNIPVATYYMRPGYSVNFIENSIGDKNLVSFGKSQQFTSKLKIVLPLHNENKIALEYNWDFYSLNTLNKVQYASHGIFVTAQFRLNRK
ncbi:MAG: hypothetical protein KAG96_01545 [Ichthyobacteriaceae bacterium]|nr:hypothetical protein [Ichthyobacteriaceae bacterium]